MESGDNVLLDIASHKIYCEQKPKISIKALYGSEKRSEEKV
jgi:hypothetical protein